MKKSMFVFSLSLILSSTIHSQTNNFNKLIGKWEISTEDGQPAYLEIIDSATIILTYMGETKKCNNPQINFTKSPHWFDFSTGNSDSAIQIKSLVEIFDNDIIKWQLFVDEERTPYFTATKGEIFYLKKSRLPVVQTAKSQVN
jgi:hypothetical protein